MLKEQELEPFLPGLSALIVGSAPIGAATLARGDKPKGYRAARYRSR